MSPIVAQSRRAARLDERLLLEEQRTFSGNAATSAFDRNRHGDFADHRAALLVELDEANRWHPLQISPFFSSAAQRL
jgi:hypothetical protein